jgi:arylsulfatase A-like enzyme
LYWEFHEQGGKQAVRMGNWKGVKLNAASQPNGPIELYDLYKDVSEINNVADKHPDVVKAIQKIMQQQHRESPDFPLFTQSSGLSNKKNSE